MQDAQYKELERLIGNAKIKAQITFTRLAMEKTGCRVTSLALSREQKAIAVMLVSTAGSTDNIAVQLYGYRALPMPHEGWHEEVVSIEMLEVVGRESLSIYFECVGKLLK